MKPRAPSLLALLFRAALTMTLAAALSACSGSDTKGARKTKARAPEGPRVVRRVDPTDLFPADLDMVVRVDVARMRAGLGPAAADALMKRAEDVAGEDAIMGLLPCADVLWIAMRSGDLEGGDHVTAIEGKSCVPLIEPDAWRRVPSANSDLFIFDRIANTKRAGTARVIQLGKRATVFVSPVELDSIARVLHDGPDERRGNPAAEGLVSLDLRPRRLPPALERKYPSIGAIVASLDRVRATATLVDEGLRLKAEITAKSSAGAKRAVEFLSALRDSSKEGRYGDVLGAMKIEQVEHTARITWTVPARVVLALLAGEEK